MEFTYSELKSDMDRIIADFDRTLIDGDYAKAKKVTSDLLKLYQSTFGIELDNNPDFDHEFQEAMAKMNESLTRIHPAPDKTDLYLDVHNTLATVLNQIMHVSEVRRKAMELDPNAEDLIASYEAGIEDAKQEKERIVQARKDHKDAREEIVGKSPNLYYYIKVNKLVIGKSVVIFDKVNEINVLQDQIDKMKQDVVNGVTTQDKVEGQIKANEDAIKEGIVVLTHALEELRSKGIDTSKFDGIIKENAADRLAALPEVSNLKLVHEAEYLDNYRKLAQNIINAKNNHPDMEFFKKIDISKLDPNTEEGRRAIDTIIMSLDEMDKRFADAEKVQDNRIEIFTKSIEEIKEEVKIIDTDPTDRTRIESSLTPEALGKIKDDEDYYRDDAYDKLYGNPEKAEKYKLYLKALKGAVVSKEFELREITGEELKDGSGNIRKGFYQTVDMDKFKAALPTGTSPEEALKLLQLEEYSERLERVTKSKAGDRFVYTQLPSYKIYSDPSATDDTRNKALRLMASELEEDAVYVKTNHLASNTHEFMAKAIGDAGTLVQYRNGRKLIKEQKGFGKVGAVFFNAGSLLGLINPGKVGSTKGKIFTTAIDGLLLASSPILLPTKLIYRYTPFIGKDAQKKKYLEKYADEDSSPYDGLDYSRKMKRREYYKSKMGGIFKGARAWIKATNDDLFNSKRAKETEKAFTEEYLQREVIPSVKARYVTGAVATETVKREKAAQNLTTRIDAIREIASRDYAYNDLIADPERADEEFFERRVIQGAALELGGQKAEDLRYSESGVARDLRHVNGRTSIARVLGALHGDLAADQIDFSTPQGGVANTDAIGRQTREKAIIGRKTATNYIPYTLTALAVGAGAKYGISKIKDVVETTVKGRPGYSYKKFDHYEDVVIGQREGVVGQEEVVVGHRYDTSTMPSTPRQFTSAYDGQNGELFYSVWGGERQGITNTNLTNFDYSAGFHIESADGTIRFALANHQNGGQYDYLGPLVRDYGMSQTQIDKFIDPITGAFRPDADLFELAAEAMTASGKQGITGDLLKEMVANGSAKSYVQLVSRDGGKFGGWLNTMTGQTMPTLEDITELRDVMGMIDITAKQRMYIDVNVPAIPDSIGYVTDETLKVIKSRLAKTVMGMGGATLVEGTAKLASMPKSDEHGTDKANNNEPRRSSKQALDEKLSRLDDERS